PGQGDQVAEEPSVVGAAAGRAVPAAAARAPQPGPPCQVQGRGDVVRGLGPDDGSRAAHGGVGGAQGLVARVAGGDHLPGQRVRQGAQGAGHRPLLSASTRSRTAGTISSAKSASCRSGSAAGQRTEVTNLTSTVPSVRVSTHRRTSPTRPRPDRGAPNGPIAPVTL